VAARTISLASNIDDVRSDSFDSLNFGPLPLATSVNVGISLVSRRTTS